MGLDLTVFGGEPLLYPEKVVALLDSFHGFHNKRVNIVSNGTHINPRLLSLLVGKGLNVLQLSFDGGAATHDLTRHNSAGMGSYHCIMSNVRSISSVQGITLFCRVNVTQSNYKDLPNLITDLRENITCPNKCIIYFQIIRDVGGFSYATSLNDDVCDVLLSCYAHASQYGFNVLAPTDTRQCLTCGIIKNPYSCVIGPDGSLYSCLEAVGRPGLVIGDIAHGYYAYADGPRWVHCGYDALNVIHRSQTDYLDARILDLLRDQGKLGHCDKTYYGLVH